MNEAIYIVRYWYQDEEPQDLLDTNQMFFNYDSAMEAYQNDWEDGYDKGKEGKIFKLIINPKLFKEV